jgi:hypothetical protein
MGARRAGALTRFDLPPDLVVGKRRRARSACVGGEYEPESKVGVAEVGEREPIGCRPERLRNVDEDVGLEHAALADALLEAADGDDERPRGDGLVVIADDGADDCEERDKYAARSETLGGYSRPSTRTGVRPRRPW